MNINKILLELGKNLRTINNKPLTFEFSKDYNIDIAGSDEIGYYVEVSYKEQKINQTKHFSNREEANLFARQLIEKHKTTQQNSI